MTATPAQIAQLTEYDFYVLFDKSGSMEQPVKAGASRTRWQAMQETALQIATAVSKIDSDGITIGFFGGPVVAPVENVTPDKIGDIFGKYRPGGSTPTAEALASMFKLSNASAKKDFIIVFTDGQPDDQGALAQVIAMQANSQANDDDCTILFVQVGDDQGATNALRQLDDDLTTGKWKAKFDIVDAKTLDEVDGYASIEELLLNAITD